MHFQDRIKDLISSAKAWQLMLAKNYSGDSGSGCGSVGRAVASDTRGPRFESSHWQTGIPDIYLRNVEKTTIKRKEAGNGPF